MHTGHNNHTEALVMMNTGVRGQAAVAGGLLATGHYPGRARSADELRCDLEKVLAQATHLAKCSGPSASRSTAAPSVSA